VLAHPALLAGVTSRMAPRLGWLAGSLAERYEAHQHGDAARGPPRESVTVSVPVDYRAARTRHPDAVALKAGVKLAAVAVLQEEGVERVEERHVCGGVARPSAHPLARSRTGV
jgi:hypothetical protein